MVNLNRIDPFMFPNVALVKNLDFGGFAPTNVATFNGGPFTNYRNKIINGDFDIWQHGTSFTSPSSGQYLADMTRPSYDGTGMTRTISRQTHTVGQTAVPGNPTYFFRYNQSVAGSGATYSTIQIIMEGAKTLAGKTATITFYCQFTSANTLPAIYTQQVFGSGGSPSSIVSTTAASSVAVGTSWQKVQYTVAIPSISGKTLGTNGNDYLCINIGLPINTTFTFDISHVSVVEGDATSELDPFSARLPAQELRMCQRYFLAMGGSVSFERIGHGLGSGGATTANIFIPFHTIMRAAPSLSYSALGDFQLEDGTSGWTPTSLTLDQSGIRGVSLTFGTGSGLATKLVYDLHAAGTLNCRLNFSAEL